MKQRKKTYPNDSKTLFGIAIHGLIGVAGAALMSTLFMVYLTDYAGIGPWGALLATTVLFAGRIFDAINDPIQGWIMDSAKVTRLGKYKKFIIISIIITTISLICLYNIPTAIVSKPVLVGAWVILFYFAYDVGASFNAFVPLVQSLTSDDSLRAKFYSVSRIVGTIGAVPMGLILTFSLALGDKMGGVKKSIGILTFLTVLIIGLISLLGIALVKEGTPIETEESERIKFRDIFNMIKNNKAMTVQVFASLFAGFMWTISFAVQTYYVKWAFAADLTTGVVDNAKFATYTITLGMATMLPIFLVTGFSPMIIRKLGSNVKASILSHILVIIPSLLLYILQLIGVLQNNFALFFLIMLVISCGSSIGFVPGTGIWTECIDYNRYITGKEMGGLVSAIRSLLEKGQNAIAGALVGSLLIAIGYTVDSTTGNFIGDLSKMPTLLNNLVLLISILPAILGGITIYIYKKWYPITPELKVKMKEKFDAEMKEVES